MGRTGWESAVLGIFIAVAWAAPARAQNVAPPPATAHAGVVLPPVPQLRLSWPVAPLRFSFSGTEVTGYANGPLRLFRAESLWLETPAFQLLTATSAERAFELDCSLTCQPIAKYTFDVEARVPLLRSSPDATVTEAHAFLRSSSYYTSQSAHRAGLLTTGIAGTLNF